MKKNNIFVKTILKLMKINLMKIKEKLQYKKFWLGTVVFMIGYPLIANAIKLWWTYDFDFTAFRADQPFSENTYFFILFEVVKSFIIGFLVVLFSFKLEEKPTS